MSIIEEVENILKIEQSLDTEALRNVYVFSAVYKVYIREARKYKEMLLAYDKLELYRWKHYNGKLNSEHYRKEPQPVAILKTDMDKYLKADAVLSEAKQNLHQQEVIIKFLEDAIKRANNRGYDIKCAIDYELFKSGK